MYVKRWRGFAEYYFGRSRSLSKMLIIFEPHGIFNQILHAYTFEHYQDTGMLNGDKAQSNIFPIDPKTLARALYNVSELAPILQGYILLWCVVVASYRKFTESYHI